MVDLKSTLGAATSALRRRPEDLLAYTIIYAVALYGSIPLFSASSIPPGCDSAMHFSKIRVFSQLFPSLPRWFPWWYCGTPSLRFYPPLSYSVSSLVGWLCASPIEAYKLIDFFSFFLAGLFIYQFMEVLTNSHSASVSSAMLYMLSPQTLYGRFFVGHYTHNFSLFFVPLTLFCIAKYGDNTRRTILITAPLFSLIFISHLQTTLSFGFMLGIYIFFSLIARWWKEDPEHTSISGLLLGGVLGVVLASFWLLPCLLEGSGRLGVTTEAVLRTMFPIEILFVEAVNPWFRAFFLGYPLIVLCLLSIVLIARRKLDSRKTFWGIIFASWTSLFLFALVSPYIGFTIGWPGRVAYFVSLPMAMSAGLSVNWIEDHVLSSSRISDQFERLFPYCLLSVMILIVSVHTYNVEQFAWEPFGNAMEVSRWISSLNLKSGERVATFGTFSYSFNVLADNWQLDGGYDQGQINPDFYYQYWLNLTTVDDVDVIVRTLNETNSRYIVFHEESEIPSAYEDQTFFERSEMHGFIVFKLRDNYTLSLVEVTSGNASVNYSSPTPDELRLRVWNCSEEVALTVKMNYYPGWVADSPDGNVWLTGDSNGFMKIDITESHDLDITLHYGYTMIDHVALGTSIVGVAIYVFLLTKRFFRGVRNGRSRVKRQGKYN
jgi:hypothetical protein